MRRQSPSDLRARVSSFLQDDDPGGLRSVSLERRRVRCGKKRCRCVRGKPHGPFVYLRLCEVRLRRHRRRLYVPKKEVRRVKNLLRSFRESRAALKSAMSLVRRWYSR